MGLIGKCAKQKGSKTVQPEKMTSRIDSDDEGDQRLVLLDKPIEIGHGTWHVLNAYQLSKMGLNEQQTELLFQKKAKITDFFADPQATADRAFDDTK